MGDQIFQSCKLKVSDQVKEGQELYKALTALTSNSFEVKLCKIDPLIIETGPTTQKDIIRLTDLLSAACEPKGDACQGNDDCAQRSRGQDSGDFELISVTGLADSDGSQSLENRDAHQEDARAHAAATETDYIIDQLSKLKVSDENPATHGDLHKKTNSQTIDSALSRDVISRGLKPPGEKHDNHFSEETAVVQPIMLDKKVEGDGHGDEKFESIEAREKGLSHSSDGCVQKPPIATLRHADHHGAPEIKTPGMTESSVLKLKEEVTSSDICNENIRKADREAGPHDSNLQQGETGGDEQNMESDTEEENVKTSENSEVHMESSESHIEDGKESNTSCVHKLKKHGSIPQMFKDRGQREYNQTSGLNQKERKTSAHSGPTSSGNVYQNQALSCEENVHRDKKCNQEMCDEEQRKQLEQQEENKQSLTKSLSEAAQQKISSQQSTNSHESHMSDSSRTEVKEKPDEIHRDSVEPEENAAENREQVGSSKKTIMKKQETPEKQDEENALGGQISEGHGADRQDGLGQSRDRPSSERRSNVREMQVKDQPEVESEDTEMDRQDGDQSAVGGQNWNQTKDKGREKEEGTQVRRTRNQPARGNKDRGREGQDRDQLALGGENDAQIEVENKEQEGQSNFSTKAESGQGRQSRKPALEGKNSDQTVEDDEVKVGQSSDLTKKESEHDQTEIGRHRSDQVKVGNTENRSQGRANKYGSGGKKLSGDQTQTGRHDESTKLQKLNGGQTKAQGDDEKRDLGRQRGDQSGRDGQSSAEKENEEDTDGLNRDQGKVDREEGYREHKSREGTGEDGQNSEESSEEQDDEGMGQGRQKKDNIKRKREDEDRKQRRENRGGPGVADQNSDETKAWRKGEQRQQRRKCSEESSEEQNDEDLEKGRDNRGRPGVVTQNGDETKETRKDKDGEQERQGRDGSVLEGQNSNQTTKEREIEERHQNKQGKFRGMGRQNSNQTTEGREDEDKQSRTWRRDQEGIDRHNSEPSKIERENADSEQEIWNSNCKEGKDRKKGGQNRGEPVIARQTSDEAVRVRVDTEGKQERQNRDQQGNSRGGTDVARNSKLENMGGNEQGVDCIKKPEEDQQRNDGIKKSAAVSERNQQDQDYDDKVATSRGEYQSKHSDVTSDNDSDSSDSGDEFVYEMEDLQHRLAKHYFKGHAYHSYFDKAKKQGARFLFKLSTKQKKFIEELRLLKFDQVGLSGQDQDYAKSIATEVGSHAKAVVHKNKIHFVGTKDGVQSAKRVVISKLKHQDDVTSEYSKNKKSTEPDQDRDENHETLDSLSSSNSSSGGARPKEIRSGRPSCDDQGQETGTRVHDASTQKDHSLSKSGNYRKDGPPVYHGKHSNLKVRVYNTDITRLEVDCIVNAANSKLKHAGGVAKAIAAVAGRKLQDACEDYISSGKTVGVTNIFVSPAGDLPTRCVLHAVGPKWDLYDKNDKERCINDLRHTVLRCLLEAGCHGMSSIALPSVSAAIFRVPPEICAQSYMEAVKVFDEFVNKEFECRLSDIHFVDVMDTMVNTVQECFMRHWEDPLTASMKLKGFDFCHQHLRQRHSLPKETTSQPRKPYGSSGRGYLSSPSQQTVGSAGRGYSPAGSFTSPSSLGATATGEQKSENDVQYKIGEIQLCLSSSPALSIPSGPIITVGDVFDKLSGLPDFNAKSSKKPCSEMYQNKKHYEFFMISKPDGKRHRLVCTIKVDASDQEGSKIAFGLMNAAIVIAGIRAQTTVRTVTSIIVTSSHLYAEANYKKKGKNEVKTLDRKTVKRFAHQLFDYLSKASQETQLKRVTVAASEEAIPLMSDVLTSRGVDIKTTSSATGANHYTQSLGGTGNIHRGMSPSRNLRRGTSPYRAQSSMSERAGENQGNYPGHSAIGATPHVRSGESSSVDPNQECKICRDETRAATPVFCCNKLVCSVCEKKMAFCPFCRKFWKILRGDQPDGKMHVETVNDHADGYEHSKAWKIEYDFPGGLQKDYHPSPGRWCPSAKRTAYLPVTDDAFQVLMLLRLAFIRRLTFTIGTSRTTNKDNVITWNDIHHKTSLHGGTFGYPDPGYLLKVTKELADRGVIFPSMNKEEEHCLSKFNEELSRWGKFRDF